MEAECAVILSSLSVDDQQGKDDVDLLTLNWNSQPPDLKESNLVLDLVNVLSGLESSFFTWSRNRITGKYEVVTNSLLQKDFNRHVREMCSEILQIRLDQCVLVDFINENQNSFICQSLSEELLNVLDDLQESVARFHDIHIQSFLGVQRMYNYLRPSKETLGLLTSVVTDFNAEALLYDKSNLGVLILDNLEQRWRSELGLKKDLLRHLLNVCLQSYFFLIRNYILYSSLNTTVCDFFIKINTGDTPLDEYLKLGDTPNQTNHGDKLSEHDELVALCDELNEMKIRLDERYVPKLLKKVSLKVYQSATYLKMMDSNLGYDISFKGLDEIVPELEIVHTQISLNLFYHLKNQSQIFESLSYFFDFYLFQNSDFIHEVIEMLYENKDLSLINKSFEKFKETYNGDSRTEIETKGHSTQTHKIYFAFDNMKNLTHSLQFYDIYKIALCPTDNLFLNINNFKNDPNGTLGSEGDYQGKYPRLKEPNQTAGEPANEVYDNLDYRNLVICYDVQGAARAVFSTKVVYKYKLMFKLLFQLKYSEYWLNRLCVYHVKTSGLPIDPDLIPKFNLQLFTAYKMNQFVRLVLNHFLVDLVSVRLSEFYSTIYSDYPSLYLSHKNLVDFVFKSMFFRSPELLSVLQRLLLIVVKFSTEVWSFLNTPTLTHFDLSGLSDDFEYSQHSKSHVERESDNLNALLSNPGYCKMVSSANSQFESNLKEFRHLLSQSDFPLKYKLL